MVDSMVALGCLSKGRSSSPALLRLARIVAAHSALFGLRLLFRYVASELNVADGPSRGKHIGAALETIQSHMDRITAQAATTQSSQQQLAELTTRNVAELLQRGRQAKGFAGG